MITLQSPGASICLSVLRRSLDLLSVCLSLDKTLFFHLSVLKQNRVLPSVCSETKLCWQYYCVLSDLSVIIKSLAFLSICPSKKHLPINIFWSSRPNLNAMIICIKQGLSFENQHRLTFNLAAMTLKLLWVYMR